jgi:hypothetical protein
VTSLKRLLGTPDVRAKLGVDVKQGELLVVGEPARVAKALMYVVNDLATGTTKVKDIYSRDQRIAYAQALPKRVVVPRAKNHGTTASMPTKKVLPKRRAKPSRRETQDELIPNGCVLRVTNPRVRAIEEELRQLNCTKYPNATAVLFRVFIELSVDYYIENNCVEVPSNPSLRNKIQSVINHLLSCNKLSKPQAAPVRRAIQRGAFLGASVDLMNEYVHNKYMFPMPGDLHSGWNSLQPFVQALWSP